MKSGALEAREWFDLITSDRVAVPVSLRQVTLLRRSRRVTFSFKGLFPSRTIGLSTGDINLLGLSLARRGWQLDSLRPVCIERWRAPVTSPGAP